MQRSSRPSIPAEMREFRHGMRGMTNAVNSLVEQNTALVSKMDQILDVIHHGGGQSAGRAKTKRTMQGHSDDMDINADADDESDVPLPMKGRKKKFKLTGEPKHRDPAVNALHVSTTLVSGRSKMTL